MKQYKRSLFIFRRDLRLEDNNGLIESLTHSEEVIPCFIFTPEQVTTKNPFRSIHAIQFMVESLRELDSALQDKGGKLYLLYGTPHKVVEKLIAEHKIDAVYCNKDYTPYSKKRDQQIESTCNKAGVAFHCVADCLLLEPEDGLTAQDTPYRVFTPFYKKNAQRTIPNPTYSRRTNFAAPRIKDTCTAQFLEELVPQQSALYTHGGRTIGKGILAKMGSFTDYDQRRDDLASHTTGLSAHNKFGTVSIREVYHAMVDHVGAQSSLVRQLYWRDFFYHVAWFYPHVFGASFKEKYDCIVWSKSTKDFARWCAGTTGFPIVDAGMRQLNQQGYMHNRARLIVGSFLTKDLHISWQWGEKYFAQNLTDYDPCVNNGSWQWVASTGCDSQPYFRIFNPWLQQKRYDPNCTYIKTWIPELKDVDPATIHKWYQQTASIKDYPPPMLDHKTATKKTRELYRVVCT